jgi:hypothetical protein
MVYFAAGYATGADGREACIQAVEQAQAALKRGTEDISLALIFSSDEFQLADVLNGATAALPDVPMAGYSSRAVWTPGGARSRGVAVALVGGGSPGETFWWEAAEVAAARLPKELSGRLSAGGQAGVLVFADGSAETAAGLTGGLGALPALAGCLTGDQDSQRGVYQFGGGGGARAGAAVTVLPEGIRMGVGSAHGWQAVGLGFSVSAAEGLRVRELDGSPAVDVYARIFGRQARQWLLPPLNGLVRLYPFGLETGNGGLLVRSPLQVEVDGSFRMSAPVAAGARGQLMVGSAATCEAAVRAAAREALAALDGVKPGLALVFADLAWAMLAETQAIPVAEVVREVAGDVPLAGGYSVGQLRQAAGETEVLNQHVAIVLLA